MPNQVAYTFVVSDRFSRAARTIAKRTKKITGSMRKLGIVSKVAGRAVRGSFNVMKSGAIAFQASILPLIAAIASVGTLLKGFAVGLEFQDAMADLSSITGSTGKELEFLRNESLRLGKAAKVSAAATAEAFKLVASAKSELLEDPRALSQVTEQVLLLKNATGLDLATAAQAVTESLNQFGAAADQTARFVNVLAAGAKIGASEVFETQLAIRDSGVVAKRAGLSFEELNSTIQVLVKAGIKGSKAGNQLKGVLLSLESSANRKLRPSLVGINVALANLKALNLDNIQLTKLFGRENIASGGALADNAALVAKWSQELKGTNVAQEQASVRLGTMSSKIRGLGVVIASKAIAVFDRLLPQFEEMAEGIGKFLDSITEEDIAGFAAGLGDILNIVVLLSKAAATAAGFIGAIFGFGSSVVKGAVAVKTDVSSLLGGGDISEANSAFLQGLVGSTAKSRTDVNVTLNDPSGAIDTVTQTTTGKTPGLNVGVNLAT